MGLMLVGIVAFAGSFIYRLDVPSTLGWHFDQQYEHGILLRKDLKRIENLISNGSTPSHRRWKHSSRIKV